MNKIFLTLLSGIMFTSFALASHGGGESAGHESVNGGKIPRGTAAWFIAESTEQLIKGLVQTKTITEEALTVAQVSLDSTTKTQVDLKTNIGPVSDVCMMLDHASHHGTIIKKEVRCSKFPVEAKIRLTRGSDAWAVVEGIEHSFRLAAVSNPNVLTGAVGVESLLANGKSVDVVIQLAEGKELRYRCLRQAFGQADMNSLSCALQQ